MFWGVWLALFFAHWEPEASWYVDPPDPFQQQLLFNLPHDYCPHDHVKKCPNPTVNVDAPVNPRPTRR